MISAIASTIFIGLSPQSVAAPRPAGPQPRDSLRRALPWKKESGARRKAQGLPSELLGDDVPAERRMVRGAVHVAMTALDRLAVEDGARAAALEQTVDGPHAEPRHERLVAAVSQTIQLREGLAAHGPIEDFPDVAPVQRAGGIYLGGSLGQPELHSHGFRRPSWTGRALSAGRELVDGALRDPDERSCQVPAGQTAQRRAIAQASVNLPAGPVLGSGPVGIDDPVGRDERLLDHDVLAAGPPHARDEPRVEDLVVRARQEKPRQPPGPRSSHGDHRPGAGVAPAREPPATGHAQSPAHRLALAAGGIEAAGEERVGPRCEEFVPRPLGEVAEPPVVRGPQGLAPGRRPAAAPELEPDVVGRVHLDIVTAVSAGIANSN